MKFFLRWAQVFKGSAEGGLPSEGPWLQKDTTMSTSALSASTSQSSALIDSLTARRKMATEQSKAQEQNKSTVSSTAVTTSSTAATPHSGSLNTKSLSSSSSQSIGQGAPRASTREVLASRQAGQDQIVATRIASGEKAYMQAIKAAQVPTSSSQPMGGSPAGPSVKSLKADAPSTSQKYSAGDAKKAPAEAQLYKPSQRAGNKALVAKSHGTGAM